MKKITLEDNKHYVIVRGGMFIEMEIGETSRDWYGYFNLNRTLLSCEEAKTISAELLKVAEAMESKTKEK